MKKLFIASIVLILIFTFAACGRRQETESNTTSLPTTMPYFPEMDPTLDTNIPDPHINTEIPTYTDPLDDLNPDLTN